MVQLLLIGCGGFLGSISRFLVSGWVQRLAPGSSFPWGTLGVNVIGCLLIGLAGGLAESRGLFDPRQRALLMIGFLGGFTTFSTFGWETLALLRGAALARAFANCGLQVGLGLVAVWAGLALARAL
ncbi:MAG TPA: fluoride efflux transporter CrcB [Thermoanaerobaculia bacterium]|nr:fluoride efflux transporter CrcB [Thermoanaerobaculia bacterium]